MTHRDSMGLKQTYETGEVQWMNAGRGVMHEEMWKLEDWARTDIEIYQIWVRTAASPVRQIALRLWKLGLELGLGQHPCTSLRETGGNDPL